MDLITALNQEFILKKGASREGYVELHDRIVICSNEGMHMSSSMGTSANGVKFGIVEWVKRNSLRWLSRD